MAGFIIVLCIIVALVASYATWGRPWLKKQPWAQPFFVWVEPLEIALFKKSETILMGRLMWVMGGLVTAYDALAAFLPSLDFTPITTRIFDALHIANDLRGLVGTAMVAGFGFLMNWMRARVTKPLDLVAVKEADAPAEVKVAIAAADEAKEQAVATVKAAS